MDKKRRPNYMVPRRHSFQLQAENTFKGKIWKKIFHRNGNQENRVAIHASKKNRGEVKNGHKR